MAISVSCRNENGQNETHTFSTDWIINGITESTVKFADCFARMKLVDRNGITTSQFRNIYGELKRIQLKGLASEKAAFHLLLPKIAYAVKRKETDGAKEFNKLIQEAHSVVKVDTSNADVRFKNFCDFIEAVLAYHKFHGGSAS